MGAHGLCSDRHGDRANRRLEDGGVHVATEKKTKHGAVQKHVIAYTQVYVHDEKFLDDAQSSKEVRVNMAAMWVKAQAATPKSYKKSLKDWVAKSSPDSAAEGASISVTSA